MSLKKRLILILLLSGFLLAVLFHFSINTTILSDLKEQEKVFFEKLKKNLREPLAAEEKDIADLCRDWAGWDGLLDYINHPSAKFETKSLSPLSLISHILNLVYVADAGGKGLYSKAYIEGMGLMKPECLDVDKTIGQITKIVMETRQPVKTILNSGYGPLLIAACPVKTGEKQGTPGTLILGRLLDKKRLKKILINFTGNIQPILFTEKHSFVSHLKQMQGKDFFHREDEETTTTLYLVKDMGEMPSLILKTGSDTKIFKIVKKSTVVYVIFTVLSIIFLGTLVYFLIEKYMSKRIINISAEMKKVQGLKDVSMRIARDSTGDEISSLVLNINNMLDKIEKEMEEKKSIEQRLIKDEKLVSIGRISSSIAHEINNPILAISNCLQALKKSCKQGNPGLNQKAIAVSETEIKRVRNIISNLLDFHRLDREEFSTVNLAEVVGQSIEILKWSKKLGSMKIITETKQNCFISGSHGKLKQVFINFILNSVEANANNKKKGILRVEVLPAENKKFCEIHFIDNGPGVSPEIISRLFEPFVSTKQEKGVGLGLYVSYKIIERHNGEILYNDAYKEGAYFIIRLPLKERRA
jgi:signal transduction histidine kinase